MTFKAKYLAIKFSKGLKYTVFATNLVAILLLLLAAKSPDTAPSSLIYISYLGLGFPVLLALNIAYLLLWIVFWRWKYIVVQVVALAFCWNAILTYLPIHEKTALIPADCIKVMSYNVRGFDWLEGDTARKNPILEYMATSNADIICLQEFAVEEKKRRKKIISLDEFDDIMSDYPYRTVIRLGDTDNSTIYGLACYSKFPIHKVARIPIESAFNGSAMYEIRIGKKRITIVNNHLESNRITAEDKQLFKELVLRKNGEMIDDMARTVQLRMEPAFLAREAQANIIAAHIKKQRENTHAMIVCGDFNDTPLSYAYQTIKGNFTDSFKTTGKGLGITYHENGILLRIDYIIHTQNIQSYNCEVGHVKYSDHYPIWSYLSLEGI
ncbi:endonuclease/exonuclease/phosphatase family protein [Viscerimonas tarda]